MKLNEAVNILQSNTSAIWWPSARNGGRIDEPGIIAEARSRQRHILKRQGIPAGEAFYVLDETNPESAIYDELASAIAVFRNSKSI